MIRVALLPVIAVCTMGAACGTPVMNREQLEAIVKDKNAAGACAEVKAPYPIAVLWINADKAVLGDMKLKCTAGEVEIKGK